MGTQISTTPALRTVTFTKDTVKTAMETLKTTTDALNIAMETVNKTTETLNTTMETVNTAVGTVNIVMETANTVVETLNTVMETTIETVNTVVEIVNTTVETLNTSTPAAIETVSLDSLPLYQISNLLWTLCPPVIFLLGVFGNVMTLVIMRRMMSSDTDSATFPLYFASMASVDLIYLFTMVLPEWVSLTFQYRLLEQHRVVCKVFTWLYTGTGTVGCWYIVLLSLHRAVSLVWPHRVNVMCTRRVVVVLLLTVTVVLAAVYSHYLYGFDLLDPSLDTSRGCLMEDEAYIQFVVEVFVYVELVIYCLLPFVCLVLANGVLVWKLSSSVRQARHSLATGCDNECVYVRIFLCPCQCL